DQCLTQLAAHRLELFLNTARIGCHGLHQVPPISVWLLGDRGARSQGEAVQTRTGLAAPHASSRSCIHSRASWGQKRPQDEGPTKRSVARHSAAALPFLSHAVSGALARTNKHAEHLSEVLPTAQPTTTTDQTYRVGGETVHELASVFALLVLLKEPLPGDG